MSTYDTTYGETYGSPERPDLGGVFDETITGGLVLAVARGGTYASARSGTHDESTTSGEVF